MKNLKWKPLYETQCSLLYDIVTGLLTNKDQTHSTWWRTFDQLDRRGFIHTVNGKYRSTPQGIEALTEREYTWDYEPADGT